MKKLFILIAAIVLLFACKDRAQAQATGTISQPTYSYLWGAATDTLIASDTINVIVRIKDKTVQDLNFGLYVTKVSGTVTNVFRFYGSMDGTNWDAFANDTIALTNASTGMQTAIDIDDFNYPYFKWEGIAGATTQKAWYKMYYINRRE